MYTGLTGKISYLEKNGEGAAIEKTIGYIGNWSVEDTADVVEVSMLGSKYKKKTVAQQSWSASADGAVDFEGAEGHNKLFAIKAAGGEIKVRFYLSAEDNTYFEGNAFIESLGVDLSAEDKGNISISLSGTSQIEGGKEYGLRLFVKGAAVV